MSDPGIKDKVDKVERLLKEKYPEGTLGDYKFYLESVLEQMKAVNAGPLDKLDKVYLYTDIHVAQIRLDKERDKVRFRMEALKHGD